MLSHEFVAATYSQVAENMPDRSQLRPGDRIRLLAVPKADLLQREQEIRDAAPYAGWTADTIERILAQDPVVVIARVDEYGQPWFDYDLETESGAIEEHTIAIMDDESWEYCSRLTD